MKNYFTSLLIGLIVTMVSAVVIAAGGPDKALGGGDDHFPWPWGSECPFPWTEIDGIYQVKATNNKARSFHNHYLSFHADKAGREGLKFLVISHFDRAGNLYASGNGFSQEDKRVVRGVLKAKGGREFTVVIRSYVKGKGSRCTTNNMVTAVAFCPLRGKKCMDESNYLLEKVED